MVCVCVVCVCRCQQYRLSLIVINGLCVCVVCVCRCQQYRLFLIVISGLCVCVQVSAVQTVSHRDQWSVCVCGLCVQVSAVQTVSHRDQWSVCVVCVCRCQQYRLSLIVINGSCCLLLVFLPPMLVHALVFFPAAQHAVHVQYNGIQLIYWLQI